MKKILDTNVLVIANGDMSQQASDACIKLCGSLLLSILRGENGVVVLDLGYQIIKEYRNNLDLNKSLAGSQFLLALLKNPKLRFEILINQQDDSFLEFPNHDERLVQFDPADRKWIALAIAHTRLYPDEPSPPIVEASDTKWHKYEGAFQDYGVVIDWLCE